MKILVFGNPLVEGDSLPIRILPELRKRLPKIEFVEFDAVEDLEKEKGELVIVDTVEGIEKVEVFTDLEQFSESPRFTMHDFDLLIYLKLLEKIGIVKKATIIGLPQDISERKAINGIVQEIRGLVISIQ